MLEYEDPLKTRLLQTSTDIFLSVETSHCEITSGSNRGEIPVPLSRYPAFCKNRPGLGPNSRHEKTVYKFTRVWRDALLRLRVALRFSRLTSFGDDVLIGGNG